MSDRIADAIAAMDRARFTMRDRSTFVVRADRVQVGDLLDFEGDPIADTDETDQTRRMVWAFELSEVQGVEIETIGDESAVVIHTGVGSFGFPPDHEIEVSLDRNMPPLFFLCGGCGHRHPAGYVGECRDDAFRFTDSELEDELGPLGVGWEETDAKGRTLDVEHGEEQ